MDSLCTANVSFKKQSGTLSLNEHSLEWVANSGGSGPIQVPTNTLSSLFSSKEGGAKVMLKVGHTPPGSEEQSHTFTFTNASSAVSDREQFKTHLSTFIARNRASTSAPTPAPDTATTGSAPSGPQSEAIRLKKAVLQSSPQLAALHRDLVMSGLITESEFWEGREDLLEAAAAEEKQKRGRTGEMVDPKPETGQGGEIRVKITATMIREIFETFPEVARAYGDNVPNKLDEQQFWTRYFQSKLFNRNRSTNRQAVSTIKDDPIFDQYLGEEDDDIEPKNLQVNEIYRLLDLSATEQDQHEVERQSDFTMRAGYQRASLPLMRRFNEHAQRLLNQSLGEHTPATSLNPGNAGARNRYYDEITLEDLADKRGDDRIPLAMDRSTMAMKRAAAEAGNGDAAIDEETEREFKKLKADMPRWLPSLDSAVDVKAVDKSAAILHARLVNSRKGSSASRDIPDSLLQQLITFQASTNEFLRQFWASIITTAGPGKKTTAQEIKAKAAKAERMKGYLDKSVSRAEELVQGNAKHAAQVQAALAPIRKATARALERWQATVAPA